MTRGTFIVFEGPEGSGKSTQIRRLATMLRESGCDVVTTREPGGTLFGERIRELLLGVDAVEISAIAEVLLLNAARSEHVRQVIQPGLKRGAVVLCDRFSDSTVAYQGGGRGMPQETIREIERLSIGELRPDVRILLDINAEAGLRRRSEGIEMVNRLDRESLEFHRAVRDVYLNLAAADPESWIVIDAGNPEDVVFDKVVKAVSVHVQC